MAADSVFFGRNPTVTAAEKLRASISPATTQPKSVDQIAQQTGVAANFLHALGEAAGAKDEAELVQIASAAAAEIAPRIQAGEKVEDVFRSLIPDAKQADAFITRAYDIADELYPAQAAPASDGKAEGGMVAALGAGVDQVQQGFGSAVEGLGRVTGMEGVAAYGADVAARNAEEAAANSAGLTQWNEVDGLGSAAKFAGEVAAQNAPQMGLSIGAGVAGAAAGAAIGSAIPIIGTAAGAVIGGIAGGMGINIPLFYGQNRERQKEAIAEGYMQEMDEGAAFLAALPQAAMDTLVDRFLVGKFLKPDVLNAGGILTRVVKNAATGVATEVPTEIGQQIIERAQAGLPLSDDEAINEYIGAGVAAGILGGGVGGAAGALSGDSRNAPAKPAGGPLRQAMNDAAANAPVPNQTPAGAAPQREPVAPTGGMPTVTSTTVVEDGRNGGRNQRTIARLSNGDTLEIDGTLDNPQVAAAFDAEMQARYGQATQPPAPMRDAAGNAPAPLFQGIQPGTPVSLTIAGGDTIQATFDSETPLAVTVIDEDGAYQEIPRAEFEAGKVTLGAGLNPVIEEGTAPKAPPAPLVQEITPPPARPDMSAPAAEALDFFEERAALIQADGVSREEANAQAAQLTLDYIARMGVNNDADLNELASAFASQIGDGAPAAQPAPAVAPDRIMGKDNTPFPTEKRAQEALGKLGDQAAQYRIEAVENGFALVKRPQSQEEAGVRPDGMAGIGQAGTVAGDQPAGGQRDPGNALEGQGTGGVAGTGAVEGLAGATGVTEQGDPLTPEPAGVANVAGVAQDDAAAAWDVMNQDERADAVKRAGYVTAKGNVSGPGKNLAASPWASLPDAAKDKLRDVLRAPAPEQAETQAAAEAPPLTGRFKAAQGFAAGDRAKWGDQTVTVMGVEDGRVLIKPDGTDQVSRAHGDDLTKIEPAQTEAAQAPAPQEQAAPQPETQTQPEAAAPKAKDKRKFEAEVAELRRISRLNLTNEGVSQTLEIVGYAADHLAKTGDVVTTRIIVDAMARQLAEKNPDVAEALDKVSVVLKAQEPAPTAAEIEEQAKRQKDIDASKAAGNQHLDDAPKVLADLRWRKIVSAFDPQEKGVIQYVDGRGIVVAWDNDYSVRKNSLTVQTKGGEIFLNLGALRPDKLKEFVVQPQTAQKPPTAPQAEETDPLRAAFRAGMAAGVVEHTTKKGKTLRGYIVPTGAVKAEQIKAVDEYAFRKDGGMFVRAEKVDAFMADGATAPDDTRKNAIAAINRIVTPENKDGTGFYTSSAGDVQIDADGNDATITVAGYQTRFVGGGKETREKSKTLRYSEVRDELSPAARAAVEAEIAANADAPAPQTDTPDAPPVTDDRKEARLRQAREIGRQAALDNEPRTAPDWMEGEIADAWLEGYGAGIAERAQQKADAAPQPPQTEAQPEDAPADDQAAAITKAAAQADPNPTPAQAEAGNYRKGHVDWNGLDLTIETAKGSERRGKDTDGEEWSVTMPADYGYIKRTEGADGEHVDFYMGEMPSSDLVVIVNQIDPETGAFDEHKVILGTASTAQALSLYEAGFSDGRGKQRVGSYTATTVEGFKNWLAAGDLTKPTTPVVGGTKRTPKIQDFGEKIGGARKDRARASIADLRSERDTASMGIGEAFPEPDYEALAAAGVPQAALAVAAVLRARIQRKPARGSWNISDWAAEVDRRRALAADVLDGTISPEEAMNTGFVFENERAAMQLISEGVPVEHLAEAAEFKAHPKTSKMIYDENRRYVGNKQVYGLSFPESRDYSIAKTFETEAEARAFLIEDLARRAAARIANPPPPRNRKPVDLAVFKDKNQTFMIGFKVSDVVKVMGAFPTKQAAADYLDANRDELQARAEELREGPAERRSTNAPRSGPTFRTGDVTPEQFQTAFGFRGVEFGNWTTGAERQTRLNEAYDALMDLAGVLGIPSEAISLNGTLGLAFGARGKGGRNPAAAHYEPSYVVMNLTKEAGAGSLAHEWFHALDNWFAKQDAKDSETSAAPTGKSGRRNEYGTDRSRYKGSLPAEVWDALGRLRSALKADGPWYQRSMAFDAARSTPYFSTTIELAARAFEFTVLTNLQARGMSNDFLVNVNEGGGAYPTMTEARRAGVTKAMNNLIGKLPALLPVADGTMVELPPLDPAFLEDGPQVGMEWEGLTGTRRITERNGDDLTIEMPQKDGTTKTATLPLDMVEKMIDRDAYDLSPEGQAEREAKRLAEEKKRADDEQRARQRAAADAALADFLSSREGRTLTKAQVDRLRSDGARLRGSDTNGYFPNYVHAVNLIDAGWSVRGQGRKRNIFSAWNAHYTGVFKGDVLNFAAWYQEQKSKKADEEAPNVASEAELAALFDGTPTPPAAEPAPEPENLDEDGPALPPLPPLPTAATAEPDLSDEALAALLADVMDEELGTADAPAAPAPEPAPEPAPAADMDPETAWDSAGESERASVFTLGGWTLKGPQGQATGNLNEAAKRALDKDWKDLTTAAQNKVRDALASGLRIGEYAQTDRAPRSAGEAAASAVRNIAGATGDALDGLFNLFGGGDPTRLGSGPTFDRDTYEAAKPLFLSAVRQYGQAGQDIAEVMRAIVRAIAARFGAERARPVLANMQPAILQFVRDVQSGAIRPFEDENVSPESTASGNMEQGSTEGGANDAGGTGQAGLGGVDGRAPEDRGNVEAGTPAQASGGAGGTGADGGEGNGSVRSEPSHLGGTGPDVARPAADTDAAAEQSGVTPRTGTNPGNFAITDDFGLGEGTDGRKISANLAAIRLVKTLDRENRYATKEEQAVLARYVGWGGLKTVFDVKKADSPDQWGRAQRALKELLSDREYLDAFASVSNAHYTAKPVVDAMWRAMRHFGFSGGRALEPTVGVGNFLGAQPADLAGNTEWFASELDTITSRIAFHLYPDATVLTTGFEKAPFREGAFDIAIGNPPFGGETITDRNPARKHLSGMKIHNYIIAKTGLHLRPGGVMAMVVTHRFLDTANPEARDQLAKDFRFLGAIRLPNDAFLANAGTEVVTDIIFLQKLAEGQRPDMAAAWLDTEGDLGGIRVNRYFAENPSHILGRSAMDGTMYAGRGEGEYTVHGDGRDLAKAIDEVIEGSMADLKGVLGERTVALEAAIAAEDTTKLPIGGMMLLPDGRIIRRNMDTGISEVTPESFWLEEAEEWTAIADAMRAIRDAIRDGRAPSAEDVDRLYAARAVAYNKGFAKPKNPTKVQQAVYDVIEGIYEGNSRAWRYDAQLELVEERAASRRLGEREYGRLKGLLDLRRKTLALIRAEFQDGEGMEAMRAALNKAYDAFVAEYGFVSAPRNISVLQGDVGAEIGLEEAYSEAIKEEVAGKKTKAIVEPERAKKAKILSERVNFPFKSDFKAENAEDGLLVSMSERGRVDLPFIAELLDRDVVEVRNELAEAGRIYLNPLTEEWEDAETYLSGNIRAKLNAATAAGLARNAEELRRVMPEPLPRDRITPTIRGQWIPSGVFEEFLMDLGVIAPKVSILAEAGMLTATGETDGRLSDYGQQFANPHKSVTDLFVAAANGRTLTISYKDEEGKSRKDEEATRSVQALIDRMGREFQTWAYQDAGRAEQIAKAYNEKVNVFRNRVYDGEKFLRTAGMNPAIKLRRTQKNGAWRIVQDNSVLLDHVVGAGKTMTIVTGVMERRRLGLTKKPLIAVPNHLVMQWAREWLQLYPGARLMAATPADFEGPNRKRMFARIATGDFDAIIVGHTSLGFMKTPVADQQAVFTDQINELKAVLDEARRNGESKRTLSQIAKRLQKYEEKLDRLAERSQDDLGFDFAEMGIDYLAVDEAHEFKNLEYSTGQQRLVGMNAPDGSKRAFDLLVKARGLQKRGGAVHFATGTPVSNSLVEVYSMLKYLAYDRLKELGMAHFDAWSAAFVEAETRFEYTATQKLKERRVMSRLVNLDALSRLYRSFADVIDRPTLERIYAEQVREENARTGGNRSERFPTPKVAGGARRLLSAPATDLQQLATDWFVARMSAIKANASNKNYPKIDNPLWVLSDARKSSLDIRTLPAAARMERDENGKVMRAAREIKRIYDKWGSVRGAQMVFSDLSTPSRGSEKRANDLIKDLAERVFGRDAKARLEPIDALPFTEKWARLVEMAYDVMGDADTDEDTRERIEKWLEENDEAESVMLVAETGFSVYDDLRTVLIEMGIPEKEIAFIHDYDTPAAKAKLFQKVNAGQVRVLIGSTPKMGAGTNAQERLVALHHIDSPWRPSDVEQREGRIIRAGNKLYEADPDGFEVEIIAYSTAGTSDVVLWQVLERKARAIGSFRMGDLDSVEEGNDDADSYAEFMAQSTGNPVFRLKMQAEKDLTEQTAVTSGALLMRTRARDFVRGYEKRKANIESGIGLLESADASSISYTDDAGETFTGDAEEFETVIRAAQDAAQTERDQWEAKFAKRKQLTDRLAKEGKTQTEIRKALEAEGLAGLGDKPTRPSILSDAVTAKSGYAKAVRALITRGQKMMGDGIASARLAGGRLVLERATILNTPRFRVRLELGRGQDLLLATAEVADPAKSPRILEALMPGFIREQVAGTLAAERDRLARLQAELPENERIAAQEVDTTAREEARAALNYYELEVRLAEAQADVDRAQRGENPFIRADRKRSLTDVGSEAVTSRQQFTLDGETFTGTGLGAQWSGKVYLFEAKRDSNGERVILLATKDDDTGTFTATEVREAPARVKREMAQPKELRIGARDAAPRPTGEAMRAVAERLNAELARTGIDRTVRARLVRGLMDEAGVEIQGRQRGNVLEVNPNAPAGALGVLRHEIVHVLRDAGLWGQPYGLFEQGEWRGLVAEARKRDDIRARVLRDYKGRNLTEAQITEEIIAEMYREWAQRRDAAGGLDRVFGKIRAFLRALANALRGQGFQSAAMTFDRIANGTVGGRGPNGGGGGRGRAMEMRGEPVKTASAAFKAWFRNSKVVDADGNPLVVYHATTAEFEAFDTGIKSNDQWFGRGSYFATNKADLSEHVGQMMAGRDDLRVVEAYLSIQNPYPWKMGTDESTSVLKADLDAAGVTKNEFNGETLSGDGPVKFTKWAKSQGYDGVFAYAFNNRDVSEIVAFAPTQIKSVSNRGTWNADNPNINELRMPTMPFARNEAEYDKAERGLISNLLTDAMGGASETFNLLGLVPGRALFAELGKNLPSARRYLRLKEEMDALRSEWHHITDEVATRWRKALSKDGAGNKAMMDLMHDATRAGVDPSLRFVPPQKKKGELQEDHRARVAKLEEAYADLRPRWNALPDDFKAIYREVRDTYGKLSNAFEKTLIENVKTAMSINVRRAQVAYDAEIERIADEGLTGQARADAEETAKKKLATATAKAEWGINARITKLRLQFETNKIDGPYFPLMRHGKYFVTVRDADGKVVSFSKFESEKKQKQFVREQQQVAGQTVDFGVVEDSDMREQVDPNFVAEVEQILGENVGDPQIMDMVWQRWLETLPDFSVRRSRIHRKGTPGFDGDAFRAFGKQVFHGGHQLARLKYGMQMGQAIQDARREAAETSDPNRNGLIVAEMNRRHDFVMNPTGGPVAQALTSFAFIYYLGITPAAALVNLSQTTVVGIPMLAAGFRQANVGRAARELTRALADFVQGRADATKSPRLSAEEKAAMEEAYRRGTIDKSEAHDLAGVAESGVEYSNLRMRIMKPISFLFHHTERMNREVTFLAAYRMARSYGMDHADAIQKASDLTWKTHFDYQNTSRPRLMQNDFAKVALVFRNFQLNMLWRLFRDAHQIFKGRSPEERREARTQLLGITAMMFAHAGITGTWTYALLMTLAGLFMGGDSDDAEEELKRAIVETFGPGAGGILLKGIPGQITGVDLTSRMGMPELWFRTSDRQLEGDDEYYYFMEQMLGAVPAIGQNVWRGMQQIGEGNVWRGVETAMPKAIRDLMKGYRYAAEGVETYNGDPILENVSAGDALIQAMGFTPSQVAERYEQNTRLKNFERRILRDRSAILKDATTAIRDGAGIPQAVLDEIREFNGENPTYPITSDTIMRSLKSRMRASQEMEGGIRLNQRLDQPLRLEMAPSINP